VNRITVIKVDNSFYAFLEYRIRELVYKGMLEIKGIPKDRRSYSVRVKNKVETLNK
jgi:hypothetical protein